MPRLWKLLYSAQWKYFIVNLHFRLSSSHFMLLRVDFFFGSFFRVLVGSFVKFGSANGSSPTVFIAFNRISCWQNSYIFSLKNSPNLISASFVALLLSLIGSNEFLFIFFGVSLLQFCTRVICSVDRWNWKMRVVEEILKIIEERKSLDISSRTRDRWLIVESRYLNFQLRKLIKSLSKCEVCWPL